MNLNLKANQALPVTIAGSWVYLEAAEQSIVLESELGNRVTLKQDSVIKNHDQIGRVLVYSPIDQDVTIEFGFGDFVPPSNINGQAVVVTQLPKVEISAGQSVKIDFVFVYFVPKSTINGQAVMITELPKFEIAAGQSVKVEDLPELTLVAGQSVNVGQMPAVQVSQLPSVTLAAGQQVATQISSSLAAQQGVMPLSIAANTNRRKLVIKADSANSQAILIAGVYPLEAGERIELETRAAVELTGDAADTAHVLEY